VSEVEEHATREACIAQLDRHIVSCLENCRDTHRGMSFSIAAGYLRARRSAEGVERAACDLFDYARKARERGSLDLWDLLYEAATELRHAGRQMLLGTLAPTLDPHPGRTYNPPAPRLAEEKK